MYKNLHLSLLLAVSVLLSSCQKDEDILQTDYSIKSTSGFELISQHPNGWIKEARYQLSGGPTEEFEYYENGYIKSAKLYRGIPQHHLYMEVSRSMDNKPLWSKYYTPEGELWFETAYADGIPSVKKVYSDKGTAIHSYTNGELSSVEFTSADNNGTSTTTYDSATDSRNVTVTSNGQTILEVDYPYQEQVGAGVRTSTQVPVANPFSPSETFYNRLAESFFSSPTWQNDTDPIEFMLPYRLYDTFYDPGSDFATQFAVNTDLYQSVIEQYPVTEKGVLIGGASYEEGYEYFLPPFSVRDSLSKAYDENPALFELKYGNEYVEKIGYGNAFFVIGAIRNLPTSSNAAEDIKEIARKKMSALLSDETEMTTEEQEILDKVWFEVKFFSTLKQHRNGVVINSFSDYDRAVQEVNDAELSIIQLQYSSFEQL